MISGNQWLRKQPGNCNPVKKLIRSPISGTLVGVKQYFAEVGADFAGSFKDEKGSGEITAAFKKIGDECACVSNAEPAESPSYIHLKNARFFNGQGQSLQEKSGLWWRGRISEVQGFVPGILLKPGI